LPIVFSYSGQDSGGYGNDYYNKTTRSTAPLTFLPSQQLRVVCERDRRFVSEHGELGWLTADRRRPDRQRVSTSRGSNITTAGRRPLGSAKLEICRRYHGFSNTAWWNPSVKIPPFAAAEPGNHSTGRDSTAGDPDLQVDGELQGREHSFFSYKTPSTRSASYFIPRSSIPPGRRDRTSSSSPINFSPSTPGSTCATTH